MKMVAEALWMKRKEKRLAIFEEKSFRLKNLTDI
jgi:hypothetical protein